jgi:hypothetical protein
MSFRADYDHRYESDKKTDMEKKRLEYTHQLEAKGNPNIITSSLLIMINYYRYVQPEEASEELHIPTNDFLTRAARLARSNNIYIFDVTTGEIDEIIPTGYAGGKSFRRKSRRRRNKKSTRLHRHKY